MKHSDYLKQHIGAKEVMNTQHNLVEFSIYHDPTRQDIYELVQVEDDFAIFKKLVKTSTAKFVIPLNILIMYL